MTVSQKRKRMLPMDVGLREQAHIRVVVEDDPPQKNGRDRTEEAQ